MHGGIDAVREARLEEATQHALDLCVREGRDRGVEVVCNVRRRWASAWGKRKGREQYNVC